MADVDARVAQLGLGERLAFHDPGTRVAELMPAFDVFALSSVPRSEGVPTVVLEAMSCALPWSPPTSGAVSEVVEEGITGSVVPPLEPGRLAARWSPCWRTPSAAPPSARPPAGGRSSATT